MEQYRPHFVIYTLFDKDLGTNLSEEILLQEFYNKKGFQCDIPYLKHNEYFKEVVSCIDKQLPISLEVDIQIDKINVLLESYIRKASFNGGLTTANPTMALGSASIVSSCIAKLAVTLPVVGFVNTIKQNKPA